MHALPMSLISVRTLAARVATRHLNSSDRANTNGAHARLHTSLLAGTSHQRRDVVICSCAVIVLACAGVFLAKAWYPDGH